ncbi:DUF6292 family protein [Saccharothrix xinjiangensis]|uniref:DUF6292 family protein n=1 Tax=Saccharothrix xinjiangensis TaxID=204798 RepID=A0ABV9XXX6_9PSEU
MTNPYARHDGVPAGGLRGYLCAVAAELGMTGECGCAESGPPASVHLTVRGHLSSFPDRDVVLVWDEEYGWAAAVGIEQEDDLVVLSYLGGEVLPPAAAVAAFTRALLRGEHPGDPRPVRLRAVGDADDLGDRLNRYAS